MLGNIWLTVAGGIVGWAIASVLWNLWDKWRKEMKRDAKVRARLFTAQPDSDHSTAPEIMVKLIYASNGRLLEVSTKKPHTHAPGHWEWEHEMFIIEEGQTLSQAIAIAMNMKGLEK